MNNQKVASLLFSAGFVICLLQLWLPAYYLTGDGPCHLYNAQVLHDLWSNKNTGFYSRFYSQLYQPNPNWMSHLALAALLFVANGVLAEKILLTAYIVLFLSGFYTLTKRLDNASSYWRLVVFIFVFHYVLAKGFYNFSFSIALLFWVIETWLRYLDNRSTGKIALFFLLATLTFFAHPIAFAFGGVTCIALTVSFFLSGSLPGKQGSAMAFTRNLSVLVLCLLPCGILLARFASGEGAGAIRLHPSRYRIFDLPVFNCLINVTSKEEIFARAIFILLVILFPVSLFMKYRKGFTFQRYDGFFLSLVFACFLYLFFPDKLFGGSLFAVRMQYIAAIFAICCITYMLPAGKIKNAAALVFFICFLGLSFIRMSCREAASDGVTELLSASRYIRPYSVILPLDFSPDGKDAHGNMIADRNWLFSHASQYMGNEKPLIMLDNYEANTGYFPLIWQEATNPYHHLCTDGSIEAQPPYATIGYYKDKTGVTIDYILMWCYDPSWLQNENFRKLYAEINAGYHIVYTSPSGRSLLYAR